MHVITPDSSRRGERTKSLALWFSRNSNLGPWIIFPLKLCWNWHGLDFFFFSPSFQFSLIWHSRRKTDWQRVAGKYLNSSCYKVQRCQTQEQNLGSLAKGHSSNHAPPAFTLLTHLSEKNRWWQWWAGPDSYTSLTFMACIATASLGLREAWGPVTSGTVQTESKIQSPERLKRQERWRTEEKQRSDLPKIT